MQHQSKIISVLRDSIHKGRVLKVKITHEQNVFVARVEEFIDRKDVVKFNFDDLPCASNQRKSYYVDEIADIESAGFAFNNPLSGIFNKILS